MTDISLYANVECADGPCGQSTCVIIDPATQQVTHFVIKTKGSYHAERLVSIDQIVETTPNLIRLSCTSDELAKKPLFVATDCIRKENSYLKDDPTAAWRYPAQKAGDWVSVKHERVPRGELAMHRGALVKAVDGRVGHVDEFLLDPMTNCIAYVVMRKGYLWNRKRVSLSASEIERVGNDTVYLKLDKRTVNTLPANLS